jgi:hypothetical protein
MVPVYTPAIAAAGIATASVGRHVTDDPLTPATSAKAVRGTSSETASALVAWPGTKVPTPEDALAGPDQYLTTARDRVSAAVAPPVTKSVAATVAVHDRPMPERVSVTVTSPITPDRLAPGAASDSVAAWGALMVSVPAAGATVVVVDSVVVVVGATVVVVDSVVVVGSREIDVVVIGGSWAAAVPTSGGPNAPIAGTEVPAIRSRRGSRTRTGTSIGAVRGDQAAECVIVPV